MANGDAPALTPRAKKGPRVYRPLWRQLRDDDDDDDDDENSAYCKCVGCQETGTRSMTNSTRVSEEGSCGDFVLDVMLEFVLPCLFFAGVAIFLYKRKRENERIRQLRMNQVPSQVPQGQNTQVMYIQQPRNQVLPQMVIQPARQPQQAPMVPMVPMMQQQQQPQLQQQSQIIQGTVMSTQQAAGVPMATASAMPVQQPVIPLGHTQPVPQPLYR